MKIRPFVAIGLVACLFGATVEADWTRQGSDASMTKYAPDNIPVAAPTLIYRKRFYGTWASNTGNYFYGNNLVVRGGQAVLFANDMDDGTLQVTKFNWETGATLAKFPQPYLAAQNEREIDSHHFTNPLIWHSDGRIYSRRGGDTTSQQALDPQTGAWTAIPIVPPPDSSAWSGDANAFLQIYGDRLLYRYGNTRDTASYAAYDISAAAFAGGTLGAYKAMLGPFVAGDQWRYGDVPKVARNISVLAASLSSTGEVLLQAVNVLTGAAVWQKRFASDNGGTRGFYTSVSDYWRFLATEDGQFAFFTRAGEATATIRVLDLATGTEKWNRTLTDSSERPLLAYHAGALYVIGRTQQLKLNIDTGAVLWQANGSFTNDTGYIHRNYEYNSNLTNDPVYRPAVLTDDTLWFVNGSAPDSGILVGLKTSNGSVAQTIDLAALVRSGTQSLELVNDLVAADGKLGVLLNITDSADTRTPKNRYQDLYVYRFSGSSPPRPSAPTNLRITQSP